MENCCARLVVAAALLSRGLWAEDDNGLTAYKDANYAVAIPLLQKAVAHSPNDPMLQAALLSSLVYEGRTDEAFEADQRDAAAFATSPDVIAARGEFAFYMADMSQAEKLYRAAMQLKPDTPRAIFGMSRIYRAASFYRTGRLFCLKARELDPADALIMQAYLRYVPREKRRELLRPFAAAHPWLYPRFEQREENGAEAQSAVGDKKLFESAGGPQETTLKFITLMRDGRSARGVGLELKIGDGHSLRMLFDTGASGILVKQSAVDKAGLSHLGSDKVWGIGDGGTRNMFAAMADTARWERYRSTIAWFAH